MLKRFVLLVAVLPSLLLAENGLAQIGVSVKSKGMGGVGVAYPQDSLAGIANPAGLTEVCSHWDIGLTCTYFDGSRMRVWSDQLGIAWRIGKHQTLGIAATPYGGFYGRSFQSKLVYSLYQVVPCWSCKVHRLHSVGISVPLVIASCKLRGPFFSSNPLLFPSNLSNRGCDTQIGAAFQVGWLGQITQAFVLGATFRTRTWMTRLENYRDFFPNRGRTDLPPMVGVGCSWYFCPRWVAAAEIDHYFWRQVAWLRNTLGQGGDFGDANGPGFGWKNQTVAKIGVKWNPLSCLYLQLGYNYGTQPIPPGQTLLNAFTLATVKHHLTTGLGWRFSRKYELSAFYSYGFRSSVNGRGSLAPLDLTEEIDISDQQQAGGISLSRLF